MKRDKYCKNNKEVMYCKAGTNLCEHRNKCNFLKAVKKVEALEKEGISYPDAVFSVVG